MTDSKSIKKLTGIPPGCGFHQQGATTMTTTAEIITLDHFRGSSPRPRVTAAPRPAPSPKPSEHHPVLAARPERERRRKLWRRSDIVFRYYDGLCALGWVADVCLSEFGLDDAKLCAPTCADRSPFTDKRREALKELLLTPAPYMAGYYEKMGLRQKADDLDKATLAKIDALMKSDEAWLLANAGHRRKKPVQS